MTTPYDTYKDAILGIPFQPSKKPSRQGAVKAFAEMQKQLEGAQSGALVRDTLANLQSLTSVSEASIMAWVVNDLTQSNNGIYENTGSAESPSWTRRIDIPQFAICAVNSGSGSADEIQASTDLPIPTQNGRCLIILNITESNTGNVTVSFNSNPALTVKKIDGSNLTNGNLITGMYVSGFISGSDFRLITDIASSSIAANAATSETNAATSETNAATSETNAATSAANAATSATNAATSATNAATSATNAATSAIAAGAVIYDSVANGLSSSSDTDIFMVQIEPGIAVYRNNAGSETFLGWIGELSFKDLTAFKNSNETGFNVGDIIRTRTEGFSFEVAASSETEHHIANAGGEKFFAKPSPSNTINFLQFDPTEGNSGENGSELKKAVEFASANKFKLIIPDGIWRINSSRVAYLLNDLEIENFGELWNDAGFEFGFNSGPVTPLTLSADISRGDTVINVSDASNVSIGFLIDIYDTSDVVETSWNYYTAETHTVIDVDTTTNTITLDRPCNWNYTSSSPGLFVGHYPNTVLSLKGGRWRMENPNGNFKFTGLRLHCDNLTKFTDDESSDNVWGFVCYACSNIRYKDVSQAGFSYGILLNRCHDGLFNGIVGRNVRHEVDCSTWTDGVKISNVKSNGGSTTISCHPSFNITFENVVETNKSGSNNVRGLGIKILDCKTHATTSSPSYTGRVILSDTSLYSDYDVEIDGWHIDAPNVNSDGEALSVMFGNTLNVKRLNASDIFIGQNINGIKTANISQSKIGRIRCADSLKELHISDCQLSNDLYHSDGSYVIYSDNGGAEIMTISGCTFNAGTNIAAIYDHPDNNSNNYKRMISNCHFKSGISNIVWGGGENNRWSFLGCTSEGNLPTTRYTDADFIACDNIV